MSSETFNVADELRRIVAEGRISSLALQAIAGISEEALVAFVNDAPQGRPGISKWRGSLSAEESARLSTLVAQLTTGMEISDDDRLRGILETLTLELKLTIENISRLIGVDRERVQRCLTEPEAVPAADKYSLATKASYLLGAAANARRCPE